MGLKEVKDDILEEARNDADRIVEEAEQEADEIVEDAEREVEKIEEQTKQEIEAEKKSLEKRRLSNARMNAKQRELEAKQDRIDETFSEFRHRLEKLDSSEREKFVESCIEKVSFEIGDVQASEEFQDAVEEQGYSFEELEDSQGIILFSEDGERSQTFTIEKIVDNYRDYSKQVAEVLFG